MDAFLNKAMAISVAVVFGLYVSHPLTWRVELAKLQYRILRDVSKTSNWGNPSLSRYTPGSRNRAHLGYENTRP